MLEQMDQNPVSSYYYASIFLLDSFCSSAVVKEDSRDEVGTKPAPRRHQGTALTVRHNLEAWIYTAIPAPNGNLSLVQ